MRLHLFSIGRRPPAWAQAASAEYLKRLGSALDFRLREFAPKAAPSVEQQRELEAAMLLQAVPAGATLVALDERGANWSTAEFATRLSRAIGRDVEEGPFRTAFLDAPLERPAMYTLLAGIPPTWVVGMLSNNVPVLCDRVRSDPRCARIEKFVFSNEIGVRKPDPAAFAALAETLALPPERIVFVDDNEGNVATARTLGFVAIHLTSPAAFAAAWRATLPELASLVDGADWIDPSG